MRSTVLHLSLALVLTACGKDARPSETEDEHPRSGEAPTLPDEKGEGGEGSATSSDAQTDETPHGPCPLGKGCTDAVLIQFSPSLPVGESQIEVRGIGENLLASCVFRDNGEGLIGATCEPNGGVVANLLPQEMLLFVTPIELTVTVVHQGTEVGFSSWTPEYETIGSDEPCVGVCMFFRGAMDIESMH